MACMGLDAISSASARDIPARYRIDIVKNGQRWTDTVGVTSTPDTIAATAVAFVSEAALESRPEAGDRCCAEVFDDRDHFVLRANLDVSSDPPRDPPA